MSPGCSQPPSSTVSIVASALFRYPAKSKEKMLLFKSNGYKNEDQGEFQVEDVS